MKKKIAIPHAYRTLQALRSFGYDLNSSVADIIDNSIAADAENIWIEINRSDGGFYLCLVDDGKGMTQTQLYEAITIGTDQKYEEEDLGKFGLGMKSASLAHCNQLTVISRTSKNAKSSACSWDMDLVKKTNEWTFLEYSQSDISKLLSQQENLPDDYRTIVFWNDMFLLDSEFNSKKTEQGARGFAERTINSLAIHLGWVFQRFLDNNFVTSSDITINLNGVKIEPVDPFQWNQRHTEEIQLKKSDKFYRINQDKKVIMIAGFILPHKDQFPSKETWEQAKGNLSWNDAQGYYIYRANRLIKFGGWWGTKAKDEHTKLARISIDVPSEYDDEFMLSVDKSRMKLPEALRYHLKERINRKITTAANVKYRKKKRVKKQITNKIRSNAEGLNKVTSDIIDATGIMISKLDNNYSDDVQVLNQEGVFISNSYTETLMNHLEKHLRIKSGIVESGDLWTLICDPDKQDFTVIVNQDHPFYEYVYEENAGNKLATSVADSIFYTLAFAEIFSRSESTEKVFLNMRNVMSKVLDRLIQEKVF